MKRVSSNQIIWGGNYFIEHLENTSCFLVWDKDNSGNFADCELAWCSFKTSVRKFQYRWNGMLQQNMKNKEERIHPTHKPIALYDWIFKNYAYCKSCKGEGGYYEDVVGDGGSRMWFGCEDCDGKPFKILDTHLGSGSSAISADKAGLEFTGTELDKEYFDKMVDRFQKYKSQNVLEFK